MQLLQFLKEKGDAAKSTAAVVTAAVKTAIGLVTTIGSSAFLTRKRLSVNSLAEKGNEGATYVIEPIIFRFASIVEGLLL